MNKKAKTRKKAGLTTMIFIALISGMLLAESSIILYPQAMSETLFLLTVFFTLSATDFYVSCKCSLSHSFSAQLSVEAHPSAIQKHSVRLVSKQSFFIF